MKVEDIYPNLAVWVRFNGRNFPGTVVAKYNGESNLIRVKDDVQGYELACFNNELSPRDPNNLEEILANE